MDKIELVNQLQDGNRKALARFISLVENQTQGYYDFLTALHIDRSIPLIGITGPPGAGKSTLLNAIIKELLGVNSQLQVAVVAIDPTSPFTKGSLLGDRLRMSEHFNDPRVYIRSLATRGTLGGLAAKTVEITDLLRAAKFDFIFVETVGVGQSEVEIASLADTTVVVVVPESGDDVQALKAGIMEIADVFVINKSDREGAERMMKYIHSALHEKPLSNVEIPVIKTVAIRSEGIKELIDHIIKHRERKSAEVKIAMIAEHAYRIIQNQRMKDISVKGLSEALKSKIGEKDFNIYKFTKTYT